MSRRPSPTSPEFFFARTTLMPSGCLHWNGKPNHNGYGALKIAGKTLTASRRAWELAREPIPIGLYVLHRCDNRICVNPDHLFLGTQADNMRDASEKGRLAVPQRRTRGFKAAVIAAYLAGGVTAKALAKVHGVNKMTVHRWIRAATDGADQRFRCGGNSKHPRVSVGAA